MPTDRGADTMASVLVQDAATAVQLTRPPSIDTVRALCHDLRQPLAAILLLAGSEGGDVRRRMDGILDQAQWLSDMVESVIGGAADDPPVSVDVAELSYRCVQRAQPTATCRIAFFGCDNASTVTCPTGAGRPNSVVQHAGDGTAERDRCGDRRRVVATEEGDSACCRGLRPLYAAI